MKKIIITIALLAVTGLTVYGASNLILTHYQNEQVTVGNVESEHYALIVEELAKETGTLIYDHEYEYDNNKHELTYTYNVKLLDIELPNDYTLGITTNSNDIVIKDYTQINLTTSFQEVSITFGLNQDNTYTAGQVIDIVFTFDLVVAEQYNIYTFNDTALTDSVFYSTTINYTNNDKVFEIFQANNNYGNDGIMISGQNNGYMLFTIDNTNEIIIEWAAHELMDAQIIVEIDGVIVHNEVAQSKDINKITVSELNITDTVQVKIYAESGYYPIITEIQTKHS
jgi:hypothetical protein